MIAAIRRRLGWSGEASSVNRQIFSAIVVVGGLSMVSRLALAGRDLMVAARFGTSDAVDAFLTAYVLPLFAVTVFAGSFTAAAVPTFIEVRERQGQAAAQRLLSNIVALGLVVLLGVALLLAASAGALLPLLGARFSAEKMALTRQLFFHLLPLLPLSGMSLIWGALLNAGERFALAALAPALTPLVPLILLAIVGARYGIETLVRGTLIGAAGEAALVAVGLSRQGYRPWPRWQGLDPPARQVLAQYAPMIAGASLMATNPLVNQAMAALLGPGKVSALSYGNKVVGLCTQLGALSLSTAVFPHFSKLAARAEWATLWSTFRFYFRLTLAAAVPLTAVLVLLSEPIVRLAFQRGAFTADDTAVVARVQAWSLLQVPFYLGGTLVVRLISSLKANQVLMWGAVINVIVNLALAWALMVRMGVEGIALATAVVIFVSFAFLRVMLGRMLAARTCGEAQVTDGERR